MNISLSKTRITVKFYSYNPKVTVYMYDIQYWYFIYFINDEKNVCIHKYIYILIVFCVNEISTDFFIIVRKKKLIHGFVHQGSFLKPME